MKLFKIRVLLMLTVSFAIAAHSFRSSASTPCSIDVNTNTNVFYVGDCNSVSPYVSVISGSSNTVVATIPLGGGHPATSIAVNSFTNMIYVAATGSIDVINGSTNAIVAQIPTSATRVAVDRSRNYVYATSIPNSNQFLEINGSTNNVIGTLSLPSQPGPITAVPGGLVYVGVTGGAYSVNPDTLTYSALPNFGPGGNTPQDLAIGSISSRCGTQICFITHVYAGESGGGQGFLVDYNTSTQTYSTVLFTGQANAAAVAFNGSTLIYVRTWNTNPNTIEIVNNSDSLVGNVPIGSGNQGGLSEIAVNQAFPQLLYAPNSVGNTVSVINCSTNTVIATITVP